MISAAADERRSTQMRSRDVASPHPKSRCSGVGRGAVTNATAPRTLCIDFVHRRHNPGESRIICRHRCATGTCAQRRIVVICVVLHGSAVSSTRCDRPGWVTMENADERGNFFSNRMTGCGEGRRFPGIGRTSCHPVLVSLAPRCSAFPGGLACLPGGEVLRIGGALGEPP